MVREVPRAVRGVRRAGPAGGRWRALRHLRRHCVLNLLMIDTLDLVRALARGPCGS